MKLRNLVLCMLAIAGLAYTAHAQTGIPPYYVDHYRHATQVLQQEYPGFLTAFQALQEEIKPLHSSNKQAQYEALMRFFPAIEEMTYMDSFVATEPDKNGVLWDLQTEVIVSFFAIDLPTADKVNLSVGQMLRDAFTDASAGTDDVIILSEEALLKKHNMSRKEAQRIRNVLHELYHYALVP